METYSLTGSVQNFLVLLHFTMNSCTRSPPSTGMLWAALLGGGFAFLVGGLAGASRQHSHPHNNTMSRNKKFWVDQVTVPPPPPPPGERQGVGNDKGGGVLIAVTVAIGENGSKIAYFTQRAHGAGHAPFSEVLKKNCGLTQLAPKAPEGGVRPPPPHPPVRSLVGCALRRASAQAQQNKILISGTRGTFRSGKRCATECGRLHPGTGLQLPLLNSDLQRTQCQLTPRSLLTGNYIWYAA